MKIVIVTGMSGAGKSTALNMLEDEGYYCVDNMPISLIPKFAELANAGEDGYSNIAIGVDIRSGHALAELDSVLDDMLNKHFNYTILFLESSDEVLVKRYKETRRTHPLAMDDHDRIDNVIKLERDELKFLKKRADVIIDTSQMLTRELKAELEGIFFDDKNFKNLFVTVLSFGFKYGIPADADLVFDVRFLPNPYYIEELKHLTGNDKPVQDYVKKAPETTEFLEKIDDLLKFLLPNYVKEGKNSLVIAIGCTLGRFAQPFMALGLLSAGISSALCSPISVSYVLAGLFDWKTDGSDKRFLGTSAIILIVGIIISAIGTNPLALIMTAQAVNGIALPVVVGVTLYLASRQRIMGEYKNSMLQNIIGLMIFAISLILGISSFIGVFAG